MEEAHPEDKAPYAYLMRDGQPLALVGLWDAWKAPANSEWLQIFAIIAAETHDRMPVILHPRGYDQWLERCEAHQRSVDLLRPYESGAMKTDTSNPAVGNVRNNGPEMLNSRCNPGRFGTLFPEIVLQVREEH